MWTAPPITLTDEERAELFRRVAAHTTAVRAARRARIVLMAADGMPSRQISQRVGMHESNVAKWRNRFRDKGLEGLEDRPRPGGPKRFGHDERMKVAAARSRPGRTSTWRRSSGPKEWRSTSRSCGGSSPTWTSASTGSGAGSTAGTTPRSGNGSATSAACT